MSRILIKDLYRITEGKTFELTIKKRNHIAYKGGKATMLTILVNKKLYEVWEPKNKVWQQFNTQTGRGLIAKVGRYEDRFYISPIEQLISLSDTKKVVDLFELPFKDGSYILGVGIVSSQNKTQYMYLLDDKGKYLIRIPSGWEDKLENLQYSIIDVDYKRTSQKGFLTEPKNVGSLESEDIDKFFTQDK